MHEYPVYVAMETNHDLSRFLRAQEGVYTRALAEIKRGRKTSHWMWFIFPQLQGLGHSEMAVYYAIRDKEEAIHYLAHPVLGERLVEISTALLHLPATSAAEIFGTVDSLKLHSSMTLFSLAEDAHPVFHQVLDVFYAGTTDKRTTELLKD